MIYRLPDGRLCGEQVSMFIGKNLLITVQEDPDFDVFNPVRERIRSRRGFDPQAEGPITSRMRCSTPSSTTVFPVLEAVGDALEEIEDEMLDRPQPKSLPASTNTAAR